MFIQIFNMFGHQVFPHLKYQLGLGLCLGHFHIVFSQLIENRVTRHFFQQTISSLLNECLEYTRYTGPEVDGR